jgi:hypothetical protein
VDKLGVSWFYNWMPQPDEPCRGGATRADYVPMIWGSDNVEGSSVVVLLVFAAIDARLLYAAPSHSVSIMLD